MARSRRFLAALTVLLALVGVGASGAGGAPSSSGAGGSASTPAGGGAPDGLYGLEQIVGAKVGSTVAIDARRSCEAVLDTVRAGQWRVRIVTEPRAGLALYVAILTYGDQAAILYLHRATKSCHGSLTLAEPQSLRLSGAISVDAPGLELPFYCQVGPNPTGKDLSDLRVTYMGLVATADVSVLLLITAPATPGRHQLTVDEDGDEGISVLPIKAGEPPFDVLAKFFGGVFTGQGFSDEAAARLSGMFGGGGTVTVSADAPFTATVTGTALSDEEHPDRQLELSTTVHCDQ